MASEKKDPWFFAERAYAFSALMLTCNGNVAIRARGDAVISAEILNNDKSTQRFFAVRLLAAMDLPTPEQANEKLAANDPGENDLPTCVFMIGVRKPEGIYRWLTQPLVDANHGAILQSLSVSPNGVHTNWHSLNEDGVKHIIDKVNAYYDALHADSSPKSLGGNRKKKSKATVPPSNGD